MLGTENRRLDAGAPQSDRRSESADPGSHYYDARCRPHPYLTQSVLFICADLLLTERKCKGLNARIQKLDFKSMVLDQPTLPNQLVVPLLAYRAFALGTDITAVIRPWWGTINRYTKMYGPVGAWSQHQV